MDKNIESHMKHRFMQGVVGVAMALAFFEPLYMLTVAG